MAVKTFCAVNRKLKKKVFFSSFFFAFYFKKRRLFECLKNIDFFFCLFFFLHLIKNLFNFDFQLNLIFKINYIFFKKRKKTACTSGSTLFFLNSIYFPPLSSSLLSPPPSFPSFLYRFFHLSFLLPQ